MEIENKYSVNWDRVGFYLAFMGGLLTIIATIITAAWIIKSDIHSVEVRLADKISSVDSRLTKIETIMILKGVCAPEALSSTN
ncbi:MAG TPA: hypothetical protein VLF61_00655 [Rhabdochlamydiaceae bacterium]|nr:hypothetical protein [Rhabdochlamydiaceae bacterium]